MSRYNSTLILVFLFTSIFSSCGDCHKVDCPPYGGMVEINIVKDGDDLVFGPSASISLKDIKFNSTLEENISFTSFNDQIEIFLQGEEEYTLDISNQDSFKFSGKLEVINSSECCSIYAFTKFTSDGATLCNSHCTSLSFEID